VEAAVVLCQRKRASYCEDGPAHNRQGHTRLSIEVPTTGITLNSVLKGKDELLERFQTAVEESEQKSRISREVASNARNGISSVGAARTDGASSAADTGIQGVAMNADRKDCFNKCRPYVTRMKVDFSVRHYDSHS